MGKYVIKRLLQLIPVVLGITFLSFAMMRLAGGDAVTYMYENAGTAVSQEVINEARAEYGLDQPFLVQYGKWLKGMLTGNLGESYVSHQDVAASFAAKLPATLLLADEPTSALDVTLQKQVVEKLLELRKEEGTAMAVVTHNIGVVRAMADQVLVLKEGCMVEYGRLEEVLEHPKEAYTRQLLSSALTLRRAKRGRRGALMEKILKAEGLTRAFENKGERFLAVRDVSFSLYRGEAIGIVGESGSGKSTLVRMLTGLLAPTKGKIEFLSRDLTHAGSKEWRKCYREMQLVFQLPKESFDSGKTLGSGIGRA